MVKKVLRIITNYKCTTLPCLHSTANVQNKQLIADKAYLEEQLKARGTKKRVNETGRQSRQLSSNDRGISSLHNIKQSGSSVDESNTELTKDSSLQEIKDSLLDVSKDARTVVVKKEINILDDLEKEFNKQRQQEKRVEGWYLVGVKDKGRGMEENADKRQQSIDTSGNRSDIEVCNH